MELNNKFSIAHHDNCSDSNQFYLAIKNSSPAFKKEICDIYFGKKFRYKYRGQEIYDSYSRVHEVNYGNVMGVEASDEQVDNLFRIQNEFHIPISLTINQLNVPIEVFFSERDQVIGAFIDWLQEYYDKGLRMCTLANNHLIRSGVLHAKFPGMVWKNTVNQFVSTAQQVLDYLHIGYNIIQLDRSLNRNLDELRRIKEAVENFKNRNPGKYIKTCMLVREACMPSCPFKREHDDVLVYYRIINYRKSHMGNWSCLRWANYLTETPYYKNRFGLTEVPRFGTNCYWQSLDTFKEYADLVDIFKFSGRYENTVFGNSSETFRFGWFTTKHAVSSFSEVFDNQFEPALNWIVSCNDFSLFTTKTDVIRQDLNQEEFWKTDKVQKLEQKLKTCRNQCYGCHLCETTLGLPPFESLVEF